MIETPIDSENTTGTQTIFVTPKNDWDSNYIRDSENTIKYKTIILTAYDL